jgi:hypothetical protein
MVMAATGTGIVQLLTPMPPPVPCHIFRLRRRRPIANKTQFNDIDRFAKRAIAEVTGN